MTFKVLEVTKETARQWADTIARTPTMRLRNYTDLNQADRYFTGYLGEITFRDALWYYGKRWHYKARLDGKADRTDLFVWQCDVQRRINVKTNGQEHGWHLMLPERQFTKYHHDFYVAAHLIDGGEAIRFEGWLTHAELASRAEVVMLKVETRRVLFTELRAMDELFEQLDAE